MLLGYGPFFLLVKYLPFEMNKDSVFLFYVVLLYSCTAYTYFHFFNMSETSRRIRMLNLIVTKKITLISDLNEIFRDEEMIETRIQRLLSLNQIREERGLYFCSGKGFPLVAGFIFFLSRLFGVPWKACARFLADKSSKA